MIAFDWGSQRSPWQDPVNRCKQWKCFSEQDFMGQTMPVGDKWFAVHQRWQVNIDGNEMHAYTFN